MQTPNIYILQNEINFQDLNLCICEYKQEFLTNEIHLSDTHPNISNIMEIFIKTEIANVNKVKLLHGKIIVIDLIKHYKLIYQSDKELTTLHVISGLHLHKVAFKMVDSYTLTFIPYIDECSISALTNRSVSLFTIITLIPIIKDPCRVCSDYNAFDKKFQFYNRPSSSYQIQDEIDTTEYPRISEEHINKQNNHYGLTQVNHLHLYSSDPEFHHNYENLNNRTNNIEKTKTVTFQNDVYTVYLSKIITDKKFFIN